MEAGAYRLSDSFVESVAITNHLRDIEFKLSVGPMSLGKASTLPPGNVLLVLCKNCVQFRSGRIAAMALFKHPLDANDQAQDGRKEVIGILYEEVAPGPAGTSALLQCQSLKRLVIETMDPVFDVVCEAVEVYEQGPDRRIVTVVELEGVVLTTGRDVQCH